MKNKRLRKQRIIALVVLLLVLGLVLSFCSLGKELGGDENSGKTAYVEILPEMSVGEVAEKLKCDGIIGKPSLFLLYLKAKKADSQIKAGIHYVDASMSYGELAKELTTGVASEGVSVTIPEGYEFDMIAEEFAKTGLVDLEEFYNAAENAEFSYDFIDAIPERETRLEGYVFPDTYFITADLNEKNIIDMMLKSFNSQFTVEYKKRASEMGMTVDQVVNLASIIQREAANTEEMPLVSSVFHNRLKSEEYPYLQSCATVQYILDERKPVLSNADTEIDSPYNTYINKGLPLGPIASPGADAIHAALYPAETNYYFFFADKNGKTVFSETFDEHVNMAY